MRETTNGGPIHQEMPIDPIPHPVPHPTHHPNPIPPGRYEVTLAYFYCSSTRSISEDTLYIGAAVKTSQSGGYAPRLGSIAEVHSGYYDLTTLLGEDTYPMVFDVPSGADLRFSHLLLNYGGIVNLEEESPQIVGDGAVQIVVTGNVEYGPFNQPLDLQQLSSEQIHPLLQGFESLVSCNGVVAAYNFSRTIAELVEQTQWAAPYDYALFQTDEQGYDSHGCGGPSHYAV